jgi:GTPase
LDIQIGVVVHYYDLRGVAVIRVIREPIHVGDTVRFLGPHSESVITIASLQIEHAHVLTVEAGDIAALKVDMPVAVGDKIFLTRGK